MFNPSLTSKRFRGCKAAMNYTGEERFKRIFLNTEDTKLSGK